MRLAALLLTLLTSVPIVAQTEHKIPVQVYYSGKDDLGNRYAAELREAIKASAAMKLGDSAGVAILGVHIVTVELESSQRIALSTTITYDEPGLPFKYLLGGSVQVCGRGRLPACAQSDLAEIDKAVQSLKGEDPNLWAKLK
jgi:hypothetical protein